MLPEKWYILRNEGNYSTINEYFNKGVKCKNYQDKKTPICFPNNRDFNGFKTAYHSNHTDTQKLHQLGYTEISFETFKQYVLKEQPEEFIPQIFN